MRKFLISFFGYLTSLGIFLGIFFGFGFGQFVVPEYNGYVMDMAGVISDIEETNLESLIYEVRENTDVEMAVLLIDSLSGETVWYAGVQVGEKRGVGDFDKDNGVVILISIGDRERTIQVGYGLEGILTDAIAKRVGEANFPTAFRAGDYAEGVYVVIEELYKYIQADIGIMEEYSDIGDEKHNNIGTVSGNSLFFYVILGIIYLFLGFFLSDKYILEKRKSIKEKRKVKKGGWQNYLIIGLIGTIILFIFTYKAIGSAIESFLILLISIGLSSVPGGGGSSGSSYKSGGYKNSSSSPSSSSSGSSFGGFSGGSFGGGGSSGKR